MNQLTITGDFRSALTHLCAWGAAAILRDHGARSVLVAADLGTMTPTLAVRWRGDVDPGEAVHAHATAQTHQSSLAGSRYATGRLAGGAVFSPRISTPPDDEWAGVVAAREAALAAWRSTSPLATMLAAGLGQPAWWRFDKQGPRPDEGATRWEMKTRNRGEEFVRHRLSPLAEVLAARTPAAITTGLTGETVLDDKGGKGPGSRTATGLQPPGPVDSAVAWCALWGLALIPVVPQAHRFSQTPGAFPRRNVHPALMALPVLEAATVARFSNVMLSREFDLLLRRAASDTETVDAAAELAAQTQLARVGVRAILRLPTVVGGSTSAPERSLRLGALEAL